MVIQIKLLVTLSDFVGIKSGKVLDDFNRFMVTSNALQSFLGLKIKERVRTTELLPVQSTLATEYCIARTK